VHKPCVSDGRLRKPLPHSLPKLGIPWAESLLPDSGLNDENEGQSWLRGLLGGFAAAFLCHQLSARNPVKQNGAQASSDLAVGGNRPMVNDHHDVGEALNGQAFDGSKEVILMGSRNRWGRSRRIIRAKRSRLILRSCTAGGPAAIITGQDRSPRTYQSPYLEARHVCGAGMQREAPFSPL